MACKLTFRCNLDCGPCPWKDPHRKDLPTGAWKDIIRHFGEQRVRHIVFEGGEPTLRSDLNEIMSHAKSQGMRVNLVSNGTRDLAPYAPDRFVVSVDGLKATHDRLRGQGAYDRLKENLSRVKIYKDVLICLSRENHQEIEDLCEDLSGLADGFWFSFVYDYGGRPSCGLSPDERREAGQRILRLSRKFHVVNHPAYLRELGKGAPCRPTALAVVDAGGRIARGCTVGLVEEPDCRRCDLACHREVSLYASPWSRLWSWRPFSP
ncbi:MAG: radical SAM protein [Deltaproteobacteria bacterium]|nr:radical SAM protein [Deltaproteobacteria bacterium]